MTPASRLPDFIAHMQRAAAQAMDYVRGMDLPTFVADRRTQQAVLMNVVILGEAAWKVLAEYPDFAPCTPTFPGGAFAACATGWPTPISRSISNWCGRRCRPRCPTWRPGFPQRCAKRRRRRGLRLHHREAQHRVKAQAPA